MTSTRQVKCVVWDLDDTLWFLGSSHGGAATPRGERRLLQIPMDLFMRLRSNPFFDIVEERLLAHLEEAEQ